jgi:hypothetical protein
MRNLYSAWAFAVVLAATGAAQSATAQEAKRLFFEGDMVRGAQQGAPGPFCVLTSQFKHKEEVAWRIRVLDQDGKPVDDKGLKSLAIQLPDGKTIEAHFRGHPPKPPQTDYFWATSWIIPDDYPTGTFAYKVVATDMQGQTQTWEPFKIAASQLTILAGDVEIKK